MQHRRLAISERRDRDERFTARIKRRARRKPLDVGRVSARGARARRHDDWHARLNDYAVLPIGKVGEGQVEHDASLKRRFGDEPDGALRRHEGDGDLRVVVSRGEHPQRRQAVDAAV